MYIKEFIDQDDYGQKVLRSVYIIVFWDGSVIREKLQKICDSFDGERYELPELKEISRKKIILEN